MRIIVLVLAALLALPACAQSPAASWPYRADLTKSAYRTFGPGAPIAALAAQIHQESAWQPGALSWAGAQGLGQFMPPTADYVAKMHPQECSPANPFDASWAIRCSQLYLRQQISLARTPRTTECDAWAFGLRNYNGGLTWTRRDRAKAAAHGADPDRWRAVQPFNAGRRPEAHRENTEYPVRIFRLQPSYASWGRSLDC